MTAARPRLRLGDIVSPQGSLLVYRLSGLLMAPPARWALGDAGRPALRALARYGGARATSVRREPVFVMSGELATAWEHLARGQRQATYAHLLRSAHYLTRAVERGDDDPAMIDAARAALAALQTLDIPTEDS